MYSYPRIKRLPYITLMTQNSKTIRIIFLPKCTQKNCAFYVVFYTFFLRILVLSGKTKSALAMIFSGYFHIDRPWWVSPLFNSAKIRTKGAIGLIQKQTQRTLIPLPYYPYRVPKHIILLSSNLLYNLQMKHTSPLLQIYATLILFQQLLTLQMLYYEHTY